MKCSGLRGNNIRRTKLQIFISFKIQSHITNRIFFNEMFHNNLLKPRYKNFFVHPPRRFWDAGGCSTRWSESFCCSNDEFSLAQTATIFFFYCPPKHTCYHESRNICSFWSIIFDKQFVKLLAGKYKLIIIAFKVIIF